MAKPRIFISSTYKDLKEIRKELVDFINNIGYEPVTFERNEVAYIPNLLLEDSCYQEIKTCSMLLSIIKSEFGSITNKKDKSIKSITRNEYIAARDTGLPIFVFIHQSSFDEYYSFVKQGRPPNFNFIYLENKNLADFIDEMHCDKAFRFINNFNEISDIKTTLTKQWAGLFNNYLSNAIKYSERKNKTIPINSFKLFYFRRSKGFSQAQLANKAGLSIRQIQKIEDAGIKKSHIEVEDFEQVTIQEAQSISDVLQCYVGNIKAGLPDDFLSQYLLYYFKNKGTKQRRVTKNTTMSLFKSKVVLFDFDGTMTKSDDNMTTWEKIWTYLGYDINDCAKLHRQYSISEITHKEWCKETEIKFKQKYLKNTDLDKIASKIKLMDGIKEVVEKLEQNHIKMYILSGSIKYIIKKVLGPLYNKFESIKANELYFNKKGYLSSIAGTKYDFEGKADFIKQVIVENNINNYEAFFIGNSLNDEWAHQSGAQTLCINPSMTNPDHPFQWAYCIRNLKNFVEIFDYLTFEELDKNDI